MKSRWGKRLLAAALLLGATAGAAADDKITLWGTPPREKPHMTKAGEAFPPLPLPAVPLRRSEKKRPPAPPMLIANLGNFSFEGWQGSPGAVDQLLQTAKRNLDLWYGWEQLDLRQVVRERAAGVKRRTPILYLCAYYEPNFTPDQRDALRDYVLDGGTLVINCCGQRKAYDAVARELAAMFPKYELRQLPPDHPVYGAFFKIDRVSYLPPGESALDAGAAEVARPRLAGIAVGTRAAVMVSLEDVACGWNQWNNPAVVRMKADDSTKLGVNLMTYVAAEMRLAKFLSRTTEVGGPNVRPRGQLAVAQVIHSGNWDPNPSAVPMFLKEVATTTSVAVKFEHVTLKLDDPAVFNYPLLFLSGQWDPKLTPEERTLLHRYVAAGGTLWIDDASGRQEFDLAVRSLLKEAFPEAPLARLPRDHPLYESFHTIRSVRLNTDDKEQEPSLEAITLGDRIGVIYSPIGMSDGWAGLHSAYAKCYAPEDAIKLGANVLLYIMR